MGFRPKVHHLTFEEFEDPENPGDSLFADVVKPSVIETIQMTAGRREDEDSEAFTRRCLGYLAPRIKAWNVEDLEGQPTPRTVEGLLNTEEEVVVAILKKWRQLNEPEPATAPLDGSSETTLTAGPSSGHSAAILEMEHSIPTT